MQHLRNKCAGVPVYRSSQRSGKGIFIPEGYISTGNTKKRRPRGGVRASYMAGWVVSLIKPFTGRTDQIDHDLDQIDHDLDQTDQIDQDLDNLDVNLPS